jgi:hypothetical protein
VALAVKLRTRARTERNRGMGRASEADCVSAAGVHAASATGESVSTLLTLQQHDNVNRLNPHRKSASVCNLPLLTLLKMTEGGSLCCRTQPR